MSDQITLQGKAVGTVTADRFVKQDSTSGMEAFRVSTASSGIPLGVAEYSAVDGEGVNVITQGKVRLYCDGDSVNIAAGDPIIPTTNGVGVKGTKPGTEFRWRACEPLSSKGIIWVRSDFGVIGAAPAYLASADEEVTVTAAQLGTMSTIVLSYAGAVALAIPGGAQVVAGTTILIKKTGSAGAITITPSSGQIAGGATHTDLDAEGDMAVFVSDGTDWILGPSIIAS